MKPCSDSEVQRDVADSSRTLSFDTIAGRFGNQFRGKRLYATFFMIIGTLLICVAVFMVFYGAFKRNNAKTLYPASVIIFSFGLLLTLKDSISKITTSIVTVELVKQATVDADAIDKIRSRVEDQSATIDLIAKKAVSAESASEDAEKQINLTKQKLQDVDAALTEAKNTLASARP
jgi:hypothetical protein